MDIEELKALLDEMEPWFLKPVEPNIFSIGGRGHYENPISDILRFFCDGTESHGLDSLVSNALLKALNLDPFEVIATNREEVTGERKRIDIVLEGHSCVVVIENKIFSGQYNPYGKYKKHIENKYTKNKDGVAYKKVYVVLSPTGSVEGEAKKDESWQGLSYLALIDSLKSEPILVRNIMEQPNNKWLLLLLEFILNLEEVTMTSSISDDAMKFVFENTYKMKQAENLREVAIDSLGESLCEDIRKHFPDVKLNRPRGWTGKNGDKFSSLEFYLDHWTILLRAALFPDGKEDDSSGRKPFSIWHGAVALDEKTRKLAIEFLKQKSTKLDSTSGRRNCWFEDDRRFRYDEKEKSEIVDLLVEKIKLLDDFHNKL